MSIPVGISSFGMCGGLASTALDFFYSRKSPPIRTTPPTSKDDKALFDWLKQRQVESITLKDLWTYLKLMFTNKKHDKQVSTQAWLQIRQEIQRDHPVLIGLSKAKLEKWYKIDQIASIVKNHQVVVWGFEEKAEEVILYLYDPCIPNVKDVKISFNLNLENQDGISHSPLRIGPIYAFFVTGYAPKVPPNEVGI